ncbi:MAG: XdhC family protein [Gaiellaceae bacterium]
MTDVVATVIATRKSAPRPIGSKLIVRDDGSMEGSVSGGCVETDVVRVAEEVRAGAPARLVTYGITDDMALGIGLPCGGEIDVFVEPAREGEPHSDVVLTVVEGEGVGQKLHDGDLEVAARRRGRSHLLDLGDRKVFADVSAPPTRLLVYGAVDTADALCAAANQLGWHTIVADARARFATPERIPNADEILVAWPEEALEQVKPDLGTAVVLLTHDDKFDLPMIKGTLETEAFYIGLLGSRRNQERRRALLLEDGLSEDEVDRVSGPCGLDIGADSPQETALSILAEILALRAGRAGGSLKTSKRRIHAEPVAANKK